ncbi:hypothetical protein [Paraburkholderia sediminicola]|uniref:hypothetical protein n=1 Tax=Paraburkholderia sediminicola TaxID=458836 RepID=UPI0038B9B0DD
MAYQRKSLRIARLDRVRVSDVLELSIQTERDDLAVRYAPHAAILLELACGLRAKMNAAMPEAIGAERKKTVLGHRERSEIILRRERDVRGLQRKGIRPTLDF